MSGGVDSSVAALLLKKQGYDVVGVFMKFWYEAGVRENRCCSEEARKDAMRVCAKLNIPFLTWNFQKEFKKTVVDDFISGYKKGITPNPCVVCNKKIKFGLFLKKALKMGADFVATGHYVVARRISPLNPLRPPQRGGLACSSARSLASLRSLEPYPLACAGFGERYRLAQIKLLQAKDKNKDQSYFLWTLTQKQLKHCLFPIGDYLKSEVRQIAKKAGLPVTLKKESQEVCFVYDADLRGFLKTRIHADKGAIIESKTNKKIGEHDGVQFYTIGQKVRVGGTGPYYVAAKNLKKNQLWVVKKGSQNLFCKEIILKNVNWISGRPPQSAKILARIRYRQPLMPAEISKRGLKNYKLKFTKPKEFIFAAPGQSAVFYNKNGELLGGGVII